MGSLRIVCVIALTALAGIAVNVEWLSVGLAQQAKVIGDAAATNSRRGASGSTLVWATDGTPADIAVGEKIEDMGARTFGTSPPRNGSRFVVIDYPPGNSGVMHRTETIDYVIVMSGEIDMQMDASSVKLKAPVTSSSSAARITHGTTAGRCPRALLSC
jgi:hypothetical protein